MTAAYQDFESALIHGGVDGDPQTLAVNVPVYLTSTFGQKALRGSPCWEYSRTGNPTRDALEKLIAELEHGARGFAFSSGMAALTATLMLFSSGDRILISSNVYGGTYRVLKQVFARFGIESDIVDTANPGSLEAAFAPNVKALLVESPANPLLTVTDLRVAAEAAHRHGAIAIADNTFMTPYLQRPLDFGFDIVVHSATKYLAGHSDLVAGLVVAADERLAERLAFLQNATGGVLPPFDSWLLIRSIKSLAVRMDRHVANAEAAARLLASHPAVSRVYYPGLPDFPGYETNRRQARSGGAMLSFELAPGYSAEKFFRALKLVRLAESLGGAESLVCHPASMTHASIPKPVREAIGITEGLIRLSPGLESSADILVDLEQAIEASRG